MLLPLQKIMMTLPLNTVDHQEKVGGVEVRGGLPGQQPDGAGGLGLQPVGVCRGVLVGGGGTTIVGQGESGDCQYV